MKLISFPTVLGLSLICCCIIPARLAAQPTDYCSQADALVKTLEKYHYQPTELNDDLSAFVFDQSLKSLDPYMLLFTNADVDSLAKYKHSIDDQLASAECDFLSKLQAIYRGRLKIFDQLTDLKVVESDFKTVGQFELKREEYASQEDLLSRWKAYLKFRILLDYFQSRSFEETSHTDFLSFLAREKEGIKTEMICFFKESFGNSSEQDSQSGEAYLQAIASAFDPHTKYFNPREESQFNEQLSKEALSFGIEVFRNEKGKFEVYQIIPGGAAWNSNLVNEGDLVNAIRLKNGELLDLACMSEGEFRELLSENSELTFLLQKTDATRSKVSLEKANLKVQENVINSFVLSLPADSLEGSKATKKIGYIYLPSFYSDESSGRYTPNGCAADVAKELIKLKSENIEGLILDLRNNGGGSMFEGNRLAGNFINFGTTCIADYREVEAQNLKDMDRGMVFSNPMVVLVNGNSASASELFAATMQDYNRAIILGSSTFGKATIQKVIPLSAHQYQSMDRIHSDPKSVEGFVKVTIGKFFRVDGSSHQLYGVKPDIQLFPDADFSEVGFPRVLPNTTIEKKTYFQAAPELPIDELKRLHQERFKSEIINKEESIEIQSIPLAFDEYKEFISQFKQSEEESEVDPFNRLSVTSPEFALSVDLESDFEKTKRERLGNKIKNDIYLAESVSILNDLILINQ